MSSFILPTVLLLGLTTRTIFPSISYEDIQYNSDILQLRASRIYSRLLTNLLLHYFTYFIDFGISFYSG